MLPTLERTELRSLPRFSPLLVAMALGLVRPSLAQVPDWVRQKPAPATQFEKSSAERGGVNPCNTPDPGFAAYSPWAKRSELGLVLLPKQLPSGPTVDVVIHFHGHEPARKEWVRVMSDVVLVGVDLGTGSGPYHQRFSDPNAFEGLLTHVEAEASRAAKRPLRIRRVGLSAWSAGYGAIQEILTQPSGKSRVDSVILLDALHAGYVGDQLNAIQLAPFVDFAALAARGRRFFFVSHSSIVPPGYASTTETANYLVHAVGGRPKPSRPRTSDPFGLELLAYYVSGGFHVRGYAGNGPLDHCAHFGVYRDVLRYHLNRRW